MTHSSSIGDPRMPIDDASPTRSFADGTGKRKYDKNDPSVDEMRKRRANDYRSPKSGMPWAFTVTRKRPPVRKSKDTLQKKVAEETIHTHRATKKYRGSAHTLDQALAKHNRELAEKMQKIHEQQRAAIMRRYKKKSRR